MKNKSFRSPDDALVTQSFVLAAFDQHQRKLTAYASRLCHGRLEAAKDAVQHTFMQLCKQKQKHVGQNTAAWLYTTCRNRVIDEQRRLGNQNGVLPNEDSLDDRAIDPAAVCEQKDLLDCLSRLVRGLPEDQRDVIELWCHGFDSSEIASITDQKPGTVRVKLHRAIKKLQSTPEVSTWLERATGQWESSDVRPSKSDVGSPSGSRFPTSTAGERS